MAAAGEVMPTCGGRWAVTVITALTLLAFSGHASAGDVDRGEALYDKHCKVCHSLIPEYHKEGPSLHGIYGKKAGTVPFFAKYVALKGADFVWDEAMLDKWLMDPKAFGRQSTKMTLAISDPQDRGDIVAYLKSMD
ncbi:MAG: c-type cytochrome [Rhodospirillales bacterium]|nr:c-type cytochrome [Rhodospirillales bacterium]